MSASYANSSLLAGLFHSWPPDWYHPGRVADLVNAAITEIIISVCRWIARLWGFRFPRDKVPTLVNGFFNTKPMKLLTLILDFTLIDAFLFFSVVTLRDLRVQFSYFSLWAATLFCFLVVHMFIITNKDLKTYR